MKWSVSCAAALALCAGQAGARPESRPAKGQLVAVIWSVSPATMSGARQTMSDSGISGMNYYGLSLTKTIPVMSEQSFAIGACAVRRCVDGTTVRGTGALKRAAGDVRVAFRVADDVPSALAYDEPTTRGAVYPRTGAGREPGRERANAHAHTSARAASSTGTGAGRSGAVGAAGPSDPVEFTAGRVSHQAASSRRASNTSLAAGIFVTDSIFLARSGEGL
jgi:hypothetical protein